MSQWFRMYSEVVDDPKVQMLPLILFRAWVNCLCLASKNDGVLPEMKAIAYSLHITEMRAKAITDDLRAAELLDECDGVLSPHNWNGRQFNVTGSAERMRRHRLRHSDGNSDATPLRYTDTDTDTEQKQRQKHKHSDKTAYGQFANVLLSSEEFEKLSHTLGIMTNDLIEELSSAIASKGYKYKSHYATALTWARKKGLTNGNGTGQHVVQRAVSLVANRIGEDLERADRLRTAEQVRRAAERSRGATN